MYSIFFSIRNFIIVYGHSIFFIQMQISINILLKQNSSTLLWYIFPLTLVMEASKLCPNFFKTKLLRLPMTPMMNSFCTHFDSIIDQWSILGSMYHNKLLEFFLLILISIWMKKMECLYEVSAGKKYTKHHIVKYFLALY